MTMGNQGACREPLHEFEKVNNFVYSYKPSERAEEVVSSSSSLSAVSIATAEPLQLQSNTNGILDHSVMSRRSLSKTRDPSMIIYCAWAGALPRHVTKYTNEYKRRFPTSVILVILSPAWTLIIPRARHARLLMPAAALIKSAIKEQGSVADKCSAFMVTQDKTEDMCSDVTAGSNKHSITDRPIIKGGNNMLLHIVSNGGAMASVALAMSLGRTFPVSAVILDCAPGTAAVLSSTNGIFATLPASWLKIFKGSLIRRMLGRLVWSTLFCCFAVLYTLRSLFRRGDVSFMTRERLNDGSVVPKDARRCYLYSIGDDLVAWKDVEKHADDAERRGCGGSGRAGERGDDDGDADPDDTNFGRGTGIERVKFGPGAKHVALSLFDGERYWKAVERTWAKS